MAVEIAAVLEGRLMLWVNRAKMGKEILVAVAVVQPIFWQTIHSDMVRTAVGCRLMLEIVVVVKACHNPPLVHPLHLVVQHHHQHCHLDLTMWTEVYGAGPGWMHDGPGFF